MLERRYHSATGGRPFPKTTPTLKEVTWLGQPQPHEPTGLLGGSEKHVAPPQGLRSSVGRLSWRDAAGMALEVGTGSSMAASCCFSATSLAPRSLLTITALGTAYIWGIQELWVGKMAAQDGAVGRPKLRGSVWISGS